MDCLTSDVLIANTEKRAMLFHIVYEIPRFGA